MQDTIFTKIVKQEIPASIVFEDEEALAFMDIHPVSKGHLLLITKEPYAWMQDIPDNLLGTMFVKAKSLMEAMIKSFPCDYVQVSVVGKDVPHFHIHLIPRFFNDSIPMAPTIEYGNNEMQEYAEKIKKGIRKTSLE